MVLFCAVSVKLELARCNMIDCGTNWVRFLASGHMIKELLSADGEFGAEWHFGADLGGLVTCSVGGVSTAQCGVVPEASKDPRSARQLLESLRMGT